MWRHAANNARTAMVNNTAVIDMALAERQAVYIQSANATAVIDKALAEWQAVYIQSLLLVIFVLSLYFLCGSTLE